MTGNRFRRITTLALGVLLASACGTSRPANKQAGATGGAPSLDQNRSAPASRGVNASAATSPAEVSPNQSPDQAAGASASRRAAATAQWSWAKFAAVYNADLTASGALRSWMPGDPPKTFVSLRSPDTPNWIVVNRGNDSNDKRVFAVLLYGDPANPSNLTRLAFTVPAGTKQNATYNFAFDQPVACFGASATATVQGTADRHAYSVELRHPTATSIVITATAISGDATFDFLDFNVRWQPEASPFAEIQITVNVRVQGQTGSLDLQLRAATP